LISDSDGNYFYSFGQDLSDIFDEQNGQKGNKNFIQMILEASDQKDPKFKNLKESLKNELIRFEIKE
jgi:hypothetical protein